MPAQGQAQKPRKVLKAFKDRQGRQWQPGQDYTGDDAEAQCEQGNVEEAPEE